VPFLVSPKAERIRVVLDNLSTHTAGSLYQAFPPAEARRLLNRLEFHHVPKHASWLACRAVNAWIGASIARTAIYPKLQWERQRHVTRPHKVDVHHREGT
jgi:hypothetical protein